MYWKLEIKLFRPPLIIQLKVKYRVGRQMRGLKSVVHCLQITKSERRLPIAPLINGSASSAAQEELFKRAVQSVQFYSQGVRELIMRSRITQRLFKVAGLQRGAGFTQCL
ncbi:MAG: hypothetical protein RJA94_2769 [Pseudomonadota bacterium]